MLKPTTAVLIAATALAFASPAGAQDPGPIDPTTVHCPAGSAPFDGTNACACDTNASVVLGQFQPDGSFEYWEVECPPEYAPPPDDSAEPESTEVLAETTTAPPPYEPTAADLNDIPADPTPIVPAFTG
jgi:hypothetical protein